MSKLNSTSIAIIIAAVLISGSLIYFAETRKSENLVAVQPPPPPAHPLEDFFKKLQEMQQKTQSSGSGGECLSTINRCNVGEEYILVLEESKNGINKLGKELGKQYAYPSEDLFLIRNSDGKKILIRKNWRKGAYSLFHQIKDEKILEVTGHSGGIIGGDCGNICYAAVDLNKMKVEVDYSFYADPFIQQQELPKDIIKFRRNGKEFLIGFEYEEKLEPADTFGNVNGGVVKITGLTLNGKIFHPLNINERVTAGNRVWGEVTVPFLNWEYDLYRDNAPYNDIFYNSAYPPLSAGTVFPVPVTFINEFSKAIFNPRIIFSNMQFLGATKDLGEITINLN